MPLCRRNQGFCFLNRRLNVFLALRWPEDTAVPHSSFVSSPIHVALPVDILNFPSASQQVISEGDAYLDVPLYLWFRHAALSGGAMVDDSYSVMYNS